jgi:hypothetical protein
MSGLETNFLMNYHVELAERSYFVGPTPVGQRVTGGIRGGSFEGPRLRGIVEATGGDYGRMRPDDTQDADVRAVLHTDDDHLIYMSYVGLIHPVSVIRRALEGERVDQSSVYWRMVHRFEAAEGPYEWLNRVIAVGKGRSGTRSAEYEVYELL